MNEERLRALQKLIPYHDMSLVENNNKLYICSFRDVSYWRITITRNALIMRDGYQLEDELVLSANNIRKEYYNVI